MITTIMTDPTGTLTPITKERKLPVRDKGPEKDRDALTTTRTGPTTLILVSRVTRQETPFSLWSGSERSSLSLVAS